MIHFLNVKKIDYILYIYWDENINMFVSLI